ncbi:cell envelope integrity protein TolA [Marinimicrobium alkaliphilum]|uniref:cell envelope integrity protein TolA n=1 Tax=Marinimicrobium alkaliphilum TaxID=2202654 RepID=UPI0013007746|nr:cell envelope integrity protein TolA [Marinimicrobium alkaliphilum]
MHSFLVVVMAWGWEPSTPEIRQVQTPRYIQATLVEMSASAPEPAQQEQSNVIDMRERQRERERQEAERQRQQEAERQRQQQREREQREREQREREARERREREAQAQAQREREERERQERERQAREAREREARQRLDDAMAREEEFLDAQRAQTLAQSYVGQIAARIEQNWSRPPSARRDMEVELLIQLVPTGRVVNVTVTRSSGDAAFDRSAEQAVNRVERFTEVQDMPTDLFERQFRQLRLVFKPEDLRL